MLNPSRTRSPSDNSRIKQERRLENAVNQHCQNQNEKRNQDEEEDDDDDDDDEEDEDLLQQSTPTAYIGYESKP